MRQERLLRLKEVMTKTGLGSSTIYRRMADGSFPAAVKIGGVTTRWRETVIDAWIDGLPSTLTSRTS